MTSVSAVLIEQIFMLFLMIAIGYYASKIKIITPELNKGLTDFLLHIPMPLLIISAFSFPFSTELFSNTLIVLGCSLAIHLGSFFIAKIIFYKFPLSQRQVLTFASTFSNCAFLGIPVINSVYGKIGLLYSSFFIVGFHLIIWTIGIIIFTGKSNWETMLKALCNPGLISVAIGIILFTFSIKFPPFIDKTVNIIGSMTTPLSMIIIGASLADCHWKTLFSGVSLYLGTAIRLIVLPLLAFAIMSWFQLDPTVLGVCFLTTAMPAASFVGIFAGKYGGDTQFASKMVFLSTICSAVTLPLLANLLKFS